MISKLLLIAALASSAVAITKLQSMLFLQDSDDQDFDTDDWKLLPPHVGKDFGKIFDQAGEAFDAAGKVFDQAGKMFAGKGPDFGKFPEFIPVPPEVVQALAGLEDSQDQIKGFLASFTSNFDAFTAELRAEFEAQQAGKDELLASIKAELDSQASSISASVEEEVTPFVNDVTEAQEEIQEDVQQGLTEIKTQVSQGIDELTTSEEARAGSFVEAKLFKSS
jgi:hypothetical protein